VGDARLQSAHAQTGRGVADIGGPGGTAAEAAAARGLRPPHQPVDGLTEVRVHDAVQEKVDGKVRHLWLFCSARFGPRLSVFRRLLGNRTDRVVAIIGTVLESSARNTDTAYLPAFQLRVSHLPSHIKLVTRKQNDCQTQDPEKVDGEVERLKQVAGRLSRVEHIRPIDITHRVLREEVQGIE